MRLNVALIPQELCPHKQFSQEEEKTTEIALSMSTQRKDLVTLLLSKRERHGIEQLAVATNFMHVL